MTVSIDSFTFDRLNAQPLGYDETETKRGFTAKKWLISGLMTPEEWVSFISVYDSWRNSKISEGDPSVTGLVGATVSFSGSGPGTFLWSNIPCWYLSTPQGEQVGIYVSAQAEIVDANESLAVLLKTKEEETSDEDELQPDFGTIDVGGAILKLKKPLQIFTETPKVELKANGHHYISGPRHAYRVQDIEGETTAAGWQLVRQWYINTVEATTPPAPESLWPINSPTATAERKIIDGIPTDVYTVSLQRIRLY